MTKVYKPKTCKQCEETFTPERQFQNTCSFKCAIEMGRLKAKDKVKKDKRKAVKKFKESDKSHLMKECQKIANKIGKVHAYITGVQKCVTCDIPLATQLQVDGGHGFPTSTYSGIRFYTLQIRPQCVRCNRHNSGMRVEFEHRLIDMYGVEKVEWMRSFKGIPRKYTVEYLQKYKRVMSRRLKVLERRL